MIASSEGCGASNPERSCSRSDGQYGHGVGEGLSLMMAMPKIRCSNCGLEGAGFHLERFGRERESVERQTKVDLDVKKLRF